MQTQGVKLDGHMSRNGIAMRARLPSGPQGVPRPCAVGIAMAARLVVMAVATAMFLSPGRAAAYSSAVGFIDGADTGGGGGRWFTGSPAEGHDCSVCHDASGVQRSYPLYVSGLATPYTPDTDYAVDIAWPEFAAFWQQQRQLAVQNPALVPDPPEMGLVAEFVPESGRASGTIEFDLNQAQTDEFCERTRPNLNPRFGAQVFQVRAGVEAREIRAGDDGIIRCEARRLGQRCLIAMRSSCGAQRLRFRWTAPGVGAGPVWFSAGFVATDALSESFDRDGFDLFRAPILEAGTADPRFTTELGGNCALTAITATQGAGSAPHYPSAVLGVLVVLGGRVARRRRGRQAVAEVGP